MSGLTVNLLAINWLKFILDAIQTFVMAIQLQFPFGKEKKYKKIEDFTFVKDEDYLREGFYIDTRDSNPVKSSDFN